MRLDKISLVAACAVFSLSSCIKHPGEPVRRDVLYNNETDVDSEGFSFFKFVHETAVYEVGLANQVQSTTTSAKARELANKVIETYEPIIPELEKLAGEAYVVLPDPGAVAWAAGRAGAPGDSLQMANAVNEANYIAHVQERQRLILDQFNRIDRNTHRGLSRYATEKLPVIQELYAMAGGSEDHGAHH